MPESISDKVAAEADRSKLTQYRGREVIRSTVALKGAGDGLSEAMTIAPDEFEPGTKIVVAMECIVGQHRFKPAPGYELTDKTAPFILTQDLHAGVATIIHVEGRDDGDTPKGAEGIRQLLNGQKARQEEAVRRAKGEPPLGDTPGAEGWGPEAQAAGKVLRADFGGNGTPSSDDDPDPAGEEPNPLYDDDPEA